MKRKTKLYFIEKIMLKRQSKHDSKLKQFKTYNTLLPLTEGDIVSFTFSEQKPDSDLTAISLEMSPFVLTELRKFRLERNSFIKNKICFVKTSKNKMRRFMFFVNAINALEKNVGLLEDHLSKTENNFAEAKRKHNVQIASETRSHYLRMYQNEIYLSQENYNRDKSDIYSQILNLLYEEIRLLKSMESIMEIKRERKTLRIHYYFECAAIYNPDLSLEILRDDILYKVSGGSVLGTYEEKLEKVLAKINQIKGTE